MSLNPVLEENLLLDHLGNENQRIENCLKEIEEFLKTFETKQEKKMGKISPNNSQHESVLCFFLEEMFQMMCNHGLEELFLPHIEEFRTQNNLSDFTSGNIANENESQKVSEKAELYSIWEKICYHVINYMSDKLKFIALQSHISEDTTFRKHLTCFYLKCLSGIITSAQLWELHRNIRISILKDMQCPCYLGHNDLCLQCLLMTSIYCIMEDKELIYSGYFQPLVITWTDIIKIYIQLISAKYVKLLETIHQMKQTDENSVIDQSLQCFMKSTSLCQMQFKSKFFKNTERNYALTIKSKSMKDIEDYLKNNSSKSNTIATVLLKIIEIVHRFEEKILSLCLEGMQKNRTVCQHCNACECTSQGIPLMVPVDSPEQSPIHIGVHGDGMDQLPFSWNWRSSFQDLGFLTFIQRHLQEQMQQHVQHCLTKEWNIFSLRKRVPSITIEYAFQGEKKIINVMFSAVCIIKELDNFSPLLSASQGAFLPFYASFCHVLHTYVIELLSHIERILSTIPQTSSVKNLYIITTSTSFLKERLVIYNDEMHSKEYSKKNNSISTLQEKVNKLEDVLLEAILHYHRKLLFAGILQDADSHHWNNNKSLFEGSRMSFSVQMWNIYLTGLIHDVKQLLTPKLAHRVTINILNETLGHFACRYARAIPSESRVKQYRSDIITILLCVTEFLPTVCSSLYQLLGKKHCQFNNDPNECIIDSIHCNCNMLLTLLAVVSSPLPVFYKVMKKGLPGLTNSLKKKACYNAPWLSWIQPEIYPHFGQGSIMSSSSVWLNVKLSVSQTEPKPFLVVKAFLNHECTLAILFMTQASELVYGTKDNASICPKNNIEESKLKLARTIISILQFCYYQQDCMANILVPVIQRSNGWKEFDKSKITLPLPLRPWWYKALIELFYPVLKSALVTVMPIIMERNKLKLNGASKKEWNELQIKLLKHVDCSCHFSLSQVKNERTVEILCALDILSSLNDQLSSIPVTLVTCLTCLETQMMQSQQDIIMSIYDSLPLQVLLSGLGILLKEFRYLDGPMEKYFGQTLCNASNIFDTLIAILSVEKSEMDIDKQYLDFVAEHVNNMKKFFKEKSVSDVSCQEINNIQEIEDDCMQITVAEFLQYSKDYDSIQYLHRLLQTNLLWIQSSLGIPDVISTDSVFNSVSPSLSLEEAREKKEHSLSRKSSTTTKTMHEIISCIDPSTPSHLPGAVIDDVASQLLQHLPSQSCKSGQRQHIIAQLEKISTIETTQSQTQKLNLNVKVSSFKPATFNPFEHFNMIGNSQLDQEKLANFPIPWESFLDQTPLFGLTEEGLKCLLSHRWEFSGKDPLPTGYEKYVHLLKAQFAIDDEDDDNEDDGCNPN